MMDVNSYGSSESSVQQADSSTASPIEAFARLPVPEAIGIAEGSGRTKAGIFALVLGLGISVAIGFLAPHRSGLARMFDPTRIESVIPALILVTFLWGLFISRLQHKRLTAIRQISDPRWLSTVRQSLEQTGVAETCGNLKTPLVEASPLLRRVRAILDQWLAAPGIQNADVVLQEQVAHDEEETHNAYGLNRLFVWALPVMGLIGTVIGISLAVGGFAQFLSGSIDDVAVIKQNLVSVTGGLSFAFLITLEGLASSLVLMFLVSALQNRESQLLLSVQKLITDGLLPALQEVAPSSPSANSSSPEAIESIEKTQAVLLASSTSVLTAVQKAAEQLLAGIGSNLQIQRTDVAEFSRQMKSSATSLVEAIGQATAQVSKAHQQFSADTAGLQSVISSQREIFDVMLSSHKEGVEQAQSELTSALDRQAQIVANSAQSLNQLVATTQAVMESHKAAQREVFHEMLSSHREAVDNAQAELTAALNRQTQVVADHAAALNGLVAATQSAVESHEETANHILDIDLQSPIAAMTELSNQLSIQRSQLADLAQTFGSMLRGTDSMINSQQALQVATTQLHEVGLGQTLASVRDSLTAVAPILEGFRKPLVLRMVPADGENGG
jgi:biopolymer transport protein ExbB/TolQ